MGVELDSELTKGVAERMVGVKLAVVMQVVLPGLAGTAVLYAPTVWLLGHLPSDNDHWWQRLAGYVLLVFILGFVISTFKNQLYKLYEGRSYWPKALRDWGLKRQLARVDRLATAADKARTESRADYGELWTILLTYPVDGDNEPTATRPTELGNILAGYEQYPGNRYGMSSVFFWPRIWLQLDKDMKEDVESSWSFADGFLMLSAISLAGGILWIAQALAAVVLQAGREWLPMSSPSHVLLAGLAWLALGVGLYRFSLPFHRDNGEIFKSIFDLYREKVWNLTSLKPKEKDLWNAAWAYLQYAILKCPNCAEGYNAATAEKCATCGFGLSEMNRSFRETGKFPGS